MWNTGAQLVMKDHFQQDMWVLYYDISLRVILLAQYLISTIKENNITRNAKNISRHCKWSITAKYSSLISWNYWCLIITIRFSTSNTTYFINCLPECHFMLSTDSSAVLLVQSVPSVWLKSSSIYKCFISITINSKLLVMHMCIWQGNCGWCIKWFPVLNKMKMCWIVLNIN